MSRQAIFKCFQIFLPILTACGILVPNQDWNLYPRIVVLITGPPGKSLDRLLSVWTWAKELNLLNSKTLTSKLRNILFISKICCKHQSNLPLNYLAQFPGGSVVKTAPANVGDVGLIPGWGRCPGEGNGNPLQYSCLENPMDRGVWWAPVYGVTKELDMT